MPSIVPSVGRHALASKRRKPSPVLLSVAAPILVMFGAGASSLPGAAPKAAEPAPEPVSCCERAVAPVAAAAAPLLDQGADLVSDRADRSARQWRVLDIPRLLPMGLASERGLQVKTILASRSITRDFPEIRTIGGVRPDALRWHPNGLALDVMIPNPSSAEGIALGNRIVAYALAHAELFDLQDCIWRDTYYTPDGGAKAGSYGHYDHVHITTHGDGYPTGGEVYLR